MTPPQRDINAVIMEIKLQINRRLYAQGQITEEVYRAAQERIIAGGGEHTRRHSRPNIPAQNVIFSRHSSGNFV